MPVLLTNSKQIAVVPSAPGNGGAAFTSQSLFCATRLWAAPHGAHASLHHLGTQGTRRTHQAGNPATQSHVLNSVCCQRTVQWHSSAPFTVLKSLIPLQSLNCLASVCRPLIGSDILLTMPAKAVHGCPAGKGLKSQRPMFLPLGWGR